MHIKSSFCSFYPTAEDSEFLPPSASPGCQADATNTPAVIDTLELSPNSAELSQVGNEVAGLNSEANDEPEASGEAPRHAADPGTEKQEQEEVPARQRQTENEVSEVEIPNVGRIMVRADADGYNEEVRK
ncbi:hypothetical protein GOODEAATRI_009139 [Goodea atripinnis]|uniref:Uncharacterized protein n=1 Tax=Goodea atripinnis TaxID=208336 RepID=A0ABV0PCQ2_9TELE